MLKGIDTNYEGFHIDKEEDNKQEVFQIKSVQCMKPKTEIVEVKEFNRQSSLFPTQQLLNYNPEEIANALIDNTDLINELNESGESSNNAKDDLDNSAYNSTQTNNAQHLDTQKERARKLHILKIAKQNRRDEKAINKIKIELDDYFEKSPFNMKEAINYGKNDKNGKLKSKFAQSNKNLIFQPELKQNFRSQSMINLDLHYDPQKKNFNEILYFKKGPVKKISMGVPLASLASLSPSKVLKPNNIHHTNNHTINTNKSSSRIKPVKLPYINRSTKDIVDQYELLQIYDSTANNKLYPDINDNILEKESRGMNVISLEDNDEVLNILKKSVFKFKTRISKAQRKVLLKKKEKYT